MHRVLVVGSGGAGKSTLAACLAQRSGLPLIHRDAGCSMTLRKQKSKSSRASPAPKRKPGSTPKGRQSRTRPREVALAEVKDDLSKYLRLAADEEIVITRHGPAGILIGFASDEDWFEYRLEHHPEFLQRIEEARAAIRAGRRITLREIG